MAVPTSRSDTDVAIFQQLANPKFVDFNRSTSNSRQNMPVIDEEPKRGLPSAFVVSPQIQHPRSQQASGGGRRGMFARRVEQYMHPAAPHRSPLPASLEPSPPWEQFPLHQPHIPALYTQPAPPAPQAQFYNSSPRLNLQQQQPVVQSQLNEEQLRALQADEPVPSLPFVMQPDDEDVRIQKRRYLMELSRLKLKGAKLTKDYTMDDPLEDMRFEADCHNQNMDVNAGVSFVKMVLPIALRFVEGANNKFGRVLHIQGLSEDISKEMYAPETKEKWDYVLERCYRRYWRKGGSSSPAMQLLQLLGGAIVMKHMQQALGVPSHMTRSPQEPPGQSGPVPASVRQPPPFTNTGFHPFLTPQMPPEHQRPAPEPATQMPISPPIMRSGTGTGTGKRKTLGKPSGTMFFQPPLEPTPQKPPAPQVERPLPPVPKPSVPKPPVRIRADPSTLPQLPERLVKPVVAEDKMHVAVDMPVLSEIKEEPEESAEEAPDFPPELQELLNNADTDEDREQLLQQYVAFMKEHEESEETEETEMDKELD